MVDPAQPPNHNQNQGLIVTHAILMAIVTLLFGPWLVLSLHLQKSEGRRGPWSWPWFALMTLYGNMISGVTHGIIAGVRNGTSFKDPHIVIGLLLFIATLVLSAIPFVPERCIRNKLQRYMPNSSRFLFNVSIVLWVVAICDAASGIELSGKDRITYIVFDVCVGASAIAVFAITVWLARRCVLKKRQEQTESYEGRRGDAVGVEMS